MTTYTLDSAVRDYLFTKGMDSEHEYPRALNAAIKTLKDLHYDVSAVPTVAVLEVSNTKAVLPQDFVKLVRVGMISEGGTFIEIFTNNNIIVNAVGSVEDSGALESTSAGMGLNWSFTDTTSMFRNGQLIGGQYGNVGGGVYSYRLDWARGLLEFSSNVSGQVVLEYMSDPNKVNGQYTFHPFLNDALLDGIHFYMMKFKRSHSPAEKNEAHRVYLNSKDHARIRFASASMGELFNASRKTINQSLKF